MKKIICISFLAFCLNISAQNNTENWLTDHTVALQASETQQKPILVFVTDGTRSEANKMIDSEFFDSDDFKSLSSKVILLKMEVPDSDLYSKRLAAHYTKQKSAPVLAVLNAKGETIGNSLTQFNSEAISRFLDVLETQLQK